MKLLPDTERSRPLAVVLAVLALVLVYLVAFHWYVVRQVDLGREISRLEQQIARFKATIDRRDDIEQRLAQLRRDQSGSALFLQGNDPNIAAAELIRMLREWVQQHATEPDSCTVVSSQPRRATEPERFQRAVVSVRMSCRMDDFVRVLHEVESSVPLVFVDNLFISQRFTATQRTRGRGTPYGMLDIRFELYGYINQPGPGAES